VDVCPSLGGVEAVLQLDQLSAEAFEPLAVAAEASGEVRSWAPAREPAEPSAPLLGQEAYYEIHGVSAASKRLWSTRSSVRI
jgi:hypothetical protein